MRVVPAGYVDWYRLLDGLGLETPLASRGAMLTQIAVGRAWAFYPDGFDIPAALAGIVHGRESVVWFSPGPRAERVLVPLVKRWRRMLELERSLIGRDIYATVDRGNAFALRLDRLLGFVELPGDGHTVKLRFDPGT